MRVSQFKPYRIFGVSGRTWNSLSLGLGTEPIESCLSGCKFFEFKILTGLQWTAALTMDIRCHFTKRGFGLWWIPFFLVSVAGKLLMQCPGHKFGTTREVKTLLVSIYSPFWLLLSLACKLLWQMLQEEVINLLFDLVFMEPHLLVHNCGVYVQNWHIISF